MLKSRVILIAIKSPQFGEILTNWQPCLVRASVADSLEPVRSTIECRKRPYRLQRSHLVNSVAFICELRSSDDFVVALGSLPSSAGKQRQPVDLLFFQGEFRYTYIPPHLLVMRDYVRLILSNNRRVYSRSASYGAIGTR